MSVHGFFQPDGNALGILFPEYNLCAAESGIVPYIHKLEWDVLVLTLLSLLHGLLYVTENGEYWEFDIHLLRVEAYASDSFPWCTEQMGEAPPECIKTLEDYDAFLSALQSPEAPGSQKLLSWARAQGWKPVDLDEINERLKIL